MIRIDDTLLEEIGLISLPKQDRDQMLRQIYETLEMRVGMRLAERMTDQQLDEFERFIDTNDEAGALKWLESNFPDYKQVVADELEKLKAEIKKDSSKIIEAMQLQTAGVSAPQQVAAPQPQQPAPFVPPTQAVPQAFAPQQPQQQPQPFQPMPQQQDAQPAPGGFAPQQPQAPLQSAGPSIPPPPSFDQDIAA